MYQIKDFLWLYYEITNNSSIIHRTSFTVGIIRPLDSMKSNVVTVFFHMTCRCPIIALPLGGLTHCTKLTWWLPYPGQSLFLTQAVDSTKRVSTAQGFGCSCFTA